jgi:hypothetical protein
VIRERIGQAALRAYPPAVRQTRGLEMLGMMLDAGEPSNRAFTRESGSLVLGGLRERAAINARAGTRRLIADSCCQAVLIWLMLWMISVPNAQIIAGSGWQQLLAREVMLAAILACALLGYERVAALTGPAAIIAIAASSPLGRHSQLMLLAKGLVPIACLLVMVRAPQRRPRDPRQLVWLVPVAVLAALRALIHFSLPEVLALVSLGGALRLLHDPRSAIACSLVWITLLTGNAARPGHAGQGLLVILAVIAVGLMLTVAAGRLWIMRHSAAG